MKLLNSVLWRFKSKILNLIVYDERILFNIVQNKIAVILLQILLQQLLYQTAVLVLITAVAVSDCCIGPFSSVIWVLYTFKRAEFKRDTAAIFS